MDQKVNPISEYLAIFMKSSIRSNVKFSIVYRPHMEVISELLNLSRSQDAGDQNHCWEILQSIAGDPSSDEMLPALICGQNLSAPEWMCCLSCLQKWFTRNAPQLSVVSYNEGIELF
jgi:hypothetical protein